MKKSVAIVMQMLFAATMLAGCKLGGNAALTEEDICKFTGGDARFEESAADWQRYVVTLRREASDASAAASQFAGKTVVLRLNMVSAAEAGLASGGYALGNTKTAGTLLGESALCITSEGSYGEDFVALTAAEITVASFGATYQISGTVASADGTALKFTYFGDLAFDGVPQQPAPDEPLCRVDFEAAELGSSSQYTDILWGRELAQQREDETLEFDGLLYREQAAALGSYYSFDGQWEMWGGFAISGNRNLDDLGYDYSNQFSVYAPQTSQFALGYVFGEWGGAYANPVIEFDAPVKPVAVEVANANKTYHYCKANPTVGYDGDAEPIEVRLVISGFDAQGTRTGTVVCTLAAGTEVLDCWRSVTLTALGEVTRLTFDIESNDTGEYGLNVPTFFCLDNLDYMEPEQ